MFGIVGVFEGHFLHPSLTHISDHRLGIGRHLAGQVANITRRQIESHLVSGIACIRRTHQRGNGLHHVGGRIPSLVRAHSSILAGHHPAYGVVDVDEFTDLDLSVLGDQERHHRHARLYVDRIGIQIGHHNLLNGHVHLHVHVAIPLTRRD